MQVIDFDKTIIKADRFLDKFELNVAERSSIMRLKDLTKNMHSKILPSCTGEENNFFYISKGLSLIIDHSFNFSLNALKLIYANILTNNRIYVHLNSNKDFNALELEEFDIYNKTDINLSNLITESDISQISFIGSDDEFINLYKQNAQRNNKIINILGQTKKINIGFNDSKFLLNFCFEKTISINTAAIGANVELAYL